MRAERKIKIDIVGNTNYYIAIGNRYTKNMYLQNFSDFSLDENVDSDMELLVKDIPKYDYRLTPNEKSLLRNELHALYIEISSL